MSGRDDRAFFRSLLRRCTADLDDTDHAQLAGASGRCLFDFLVCAAGGLAGARPTLTSPDGRPGFEDLVSADVDAGGPSAAGLAMAAHLDDLDDVHWPTTTHPGSFVWPVLVAAWLRRPALSDPRRAAALGYQVTGRLASTLPAAHRERYHLAATAGTLGAVAGLAFLLELDERQAIDAMLHAASSVGHGAAAVAGRSRTLVHHRGTAASIAEVSVMGAEIGPPVTNPWAAYDDPALVYDAESLGPAWAPVVGEVTRRHHAVNGFAHTMVDALRELRDRIDGLGADETGTRPTTRRRTDRAAPCEDLERLEVEVPTFVGSMGVVGPVVEARQARWHLPTIAALAWSSSGVITRVPWPLPTAVAHLRDRVVITERRAKPPDLRVTVHATLSDGRDHVSARDVPYGHPGDPWSDRDLIVKAARPVDAHLDLSSVLHRLCDDRRSLRPRDLLTLLTPLPPTPSRGADARG